jgi:hypothetical protein
MNLYDLMGPMAVSAGIGVSYGAEPSRGPIVWASLLLGAAAGFGTFLAFRRVTSRAPERMLGVFYVGTPICVLAATIAVAWAVRASS